MVVRLLPWRWGVGGMSNLIVGVNRGGGDRRRWVRGGPLTAGACRMWSRSPLKPLRRTEQKLEFGRKH